MSLKIKRYDGPLKSSHGYFFWRADAHDDRDTHVNYGAAVVTADSTTSDEQNVNWTVAVNGWDEKRGHARTVRRGKAMALVALRRAMRAVR